MTKKLKTLSFASPTSIMHDVWSRKISSLMKSTLYISSFSHYECTALLEYLDLFKEKLQDGILP